MLGGPNVPFDREGVYLRGQGFYRSFEFGRLYWLEPLNYARVEFDHDDSLDLGKLFKIRPGDSANLVWPPWKCREHLLTQVSIIVRDAS